MNKPLGILSIETKSKQQQLSKLDAEGWINRLTRPQLLAALNVP